MENFYVYLYINPITNIPFYVGKGKNNRAFMFEKHNHNKSLLTHLKNLKKEGYDKNDIVSIYKKNLTEEESLNIEKKLVFKFGKKSEGGLLFNIIDGGSQPPSQKNKRYKRSEKTVENIKKSWTSNRKLKMSNRLKGKPKPKEWYDKIIKSRRNKFILDKNKFENLVLSDLNLNKILQEMQVKYDKFRDRLKQEYGTTSFLEIKRKIISV
jgi:hypothetical protein